VVGIVQSVERTLQPIGGVGPNPRWLARRLVYANTLGKYASNAVTGIKNTFAGTTVGVGRWGSVRSFNGSTDYVAEPFSSTSAKRTYFIRFQADGTGGGGFGRFWDKDGPAGGDLECNCFFDGSTITFQQAFDGGNGVWTIPHTTTGAAFSLAVVFDGTTTTDPVMYIDGVSKTVTETSTPAGNRYSNAEGFSIGNRAWDQGRGWNGWLADFLMFDELLTAAEVGSLHANPYQAWQPETLYVPMSVNTGVTLTGAAAAEATASGTMGQAIGLTGAAAAEATMTGGIGAGQALTGAAAAEATASGTMSQAVPLAGAAAAVATASGTMSGVGIQISGDYDRASVNVAASSVSGTGNSAVITIRPKMQYFEFVSESRWLEPSARVTGVNGLHPTFKFDSYDNAGPSANNYHGAPWDSTRFPMYSYDRETWHYFENKTVGASDITFYNTSDFTSDTVYIGRSRQMSVNQVGAWIDSLEAAYPTIIEPTITAAGYTPSVDVAGFSGQDFIADEFSAQVGAWGTIPITPLYAFQINDTSLTPYGGGAKRVAIITSGVHGGEDHANYVLKAVVAAMLGSSAEAQALRRNYKILIYPLINAPGRYGGGWRGSFVTGTSGEDDANRYFSNTGTGLEIINLPKAAMVADLNGATPRFGIDFHGTYEDPWEVFSNATAATGETFRARLAAVAGYAVFGWRGAALRCRLSEYLRNILGANPAFTHESGDPVKVTDAEITDHGEYVVQVLGEQMAFGLFGGAAAAEATATGSMSQQIPVAGAATAQATASGTMSIQEPVPAALATMSITLDDMSSSITATALVSASITVTLDDMGVFVFGHNSEYVAPVNTQSRTAIATVGKMM
jgi:hypothetical protein